MCVPLGCSSGGEGGGGGRSSLEHLFPGFDGQAGVCCFSRSHRGGRQRGEAERMRQRSLRELERKGGRSTGGKPLRRGRWGGLQLTGSQSEGKEGLLPFYLMWGGKTLMWTPTNHRAETAQHEPITVATKQLMNTKLKGNLHLICGYRWRVCVCFCIITKSHS